MLGNEAAHDGAAPAMGQKSTEAGLINGVLDSLKDPKVLAIAVGGALATAAAIKFGGPLLARGAQTAEEALKLDAAATGRGLNGLRDAGAVPGSLKPGQTTVLGIARGDRLEPATDAVLTQGYKIPAATDNAYFATGADSPFHKPPFSAALRKMENPPAGHNLPGKDLDHRMGIYGQEYPGPHEFWSDSLPVLARSHPIDSLAAKRIGFSDEEKAIAALSKSMEGLTHETRGGLAFAQQGEPASLHEIMAAARKTITGEHAPALRPEQIDRAVQSLLRGEEPAAEISEAARQAAKNGTKTKV